MCEHAQVFKSSSTFKCCCGLSDFEVSVSLLHSLVMVLLHNLVSIMFSGGSRIFVYTHIQLLASFVHVTTLPSEQSHLLVQIEWASIYLWTRVLQRQESAVQHGGWWVVRYCAHPHSHTFTHSLTHTHTFTHVTHTHAHSHTHSHTLHTHTHTHTHTPTHTYTHRVLKTTGWSCQMPKPH